MRSWWLKDSTQYVSRHCMIYAAKYFSILINIGGLQMFDQVLYCLLVGKLCFPGDVPTNVTRSSEVTTTVVTLQNKWMSRKLLVSSLVSIPATAYRIVLRNIHDQLPQLFWPISTVLHAPVPVYLDALSWWMSTKFVYTGTNANCTMHSSCLSTSSGNHVTFLSRTCTCTWVIFFNSLATFLVPTLHMYKYLPMS